MNFKRVKFYLTLFFGGLVYILFIWYFSTKVHLTDIAKIFQEGSIFYLSLAGLCGLTMIFFQGFLLKKVFNLCQIDLSLKEALMTWLVTIPAGLFSIGLGGPAIIFYVANKKQESKKIAAQATISFFLFYLIPIIFFVLLVANFGFYQMTNLKPIDLLLLVFDLIFLILFFLLLSNRSFREKVSGLIKTIFPKIGPKVSFLKPTSVSTRDFLITLAISALVTILNFIILIFSLKTFQIKSSIFLISKNFIGAEIISMVAPTSGGVGFVEIGLIGFLKLSGLSTIQAVLTTLVYRLVNFWLPFLFGALILVFRGYHFVQNRLEDKIISDDAEDISVNRDEI